MICILCGSQETSDQTCKTPPCSYYHCDNCDLRFVNPNDRLNAEAEKKRYLEHNNDINDPNYQKFVEPLFAAVQAKVNPGARGLDFGAGTGPVLAKRFEDMGYKISLYDPFFWPNESLLLGNYDFIVASEVVEHFYHPGNEFRRLRPLLNDGGVLGIMTLLYDSSIDFESWYYRRDPTHVSLYSRKTFEWIQRIFGYSKITFASDRVILLEK